MDASVEAPPVPDDVPDGAFGPLGAESAPVGGDDAASVGADNDSIAPDRSSRGARVGVRVGKGNKVVRTLEQYYTIIGLTVMARNEYDGQVIAAKAHDMAATLVTWAADYPRVYTILETLTRGGGLLPVLMAHGAVVYAVGVNHGRFTPSAMTFQVFGLPPAPPRAPRPEHAYEPTYGGPAPVQPSQEASQAGYAAEPVAEAPEGAHWNQGMYDRIRAEAYASYERQMAEEARRQAQEEALNGGTTG